MTSQQPREQVSVRFFTMLCCCAMVLAVLAFSRASAQSTFPEPTDQITRQLMQRLRALSADSMEGRRAGSEGSRRARRWIVSELQAIGASPVGRAFEYPVRLSPRSGTDTVGANIVARIPGRTPGGATIVVSAHYDHLGVREGQVYNGADDDASGCVALLALAERLRRSPITHDVLLVFFDAEEAGMFGSRAFVAAPPVALSNLAVNLSLDMIARQDGQALWVSGTSHYPALRPVATRAMRGAGLSVRFGHDEKFAKPGDDWTNSSDHAAFHAKGIPFLYLGVEDHADYHKPGDDADKVDPTFFRAAVDFVEALLRELDGWVGTQRTGTR